MDQSDFDLILMNLISSINEKQIKDILDNKLESPLDQDRIRFLKTRPWWNDIHNKFQLIIDEIFPGTHLVASLKDTIDLLKIDTIQIPNNNYTLQQMRPSRCHDNVFELYLKDKTLRIFSGYALSSDRLWRHHSWITTPTDDIIETTTTRLIYIGHDIAF